MGPSIMIASGVAMPSGRLSAGSHGCSKPGMRRCETLKPHRPALGLAPRPVAASSRISPPAPVPAPGCGEMPVGWLCVSTFIRMCASSSTARHCPPAPGKKRAVRAPSITAALSL
jgi:hypothetical protein